MMKSYKFLMIALASLAAAPLIANGSGDNVVDRYFGDQTRKMKKRPVTQVDDLTFIRRLYLDMTGILPEPETVDAFLTDPSPYKRRDLIEAVMKTDAHVNRWTHFFDDLMLTQTILEPAYYRNAQHAALRKMVAGNEPWDQMARTILADSGKGWREDGSFFQFWAREAFGNLYRLDYLDDQVGLITETMLGISTDCISCHDGANHLESINKDLSKRKREEFWGMAAFLAKTYVHTRMPLSNYIAGSRTYYEDLDISDIDHPDFDDSWGGYINPEVRVNPPGEYMAESEPGDGMRQPRSGGLITPRYLFTGEEPQPGEVRREALARMVTADRQFARNMVNRVWAHFMGEGFVEPLGNWDLARLDPETAAEAGADVQPREYQLMEGLTTYFIEAGYDFHALFRLILNSRIYQADYAAAKASPADSGLTWWTTDRRVRRLDAESIIDSMRLVLETPGKYTYQGEYINQVSTTWELPGPSEPSGMQLFLDESYNPMANGYASYEEFYVMHFETQRLLSIFGRGDRSVVNADNNDSTAQTVLAMMNDAQLHYYLTGPGSSPYVDRLVDGLTSQQATTSEVVMDIYKRILFREPNPLEKGAAFGWFEGREPARAVQDLIWTLFNHPDFTHR